VGRHSAAPPSRVHFEYQGVFFLCWSLVHCILSLLHTLPGSEVEES